MIKLSGKFSNFTVLPVLIITIFALSGCSPNPEGEGGQAGNVSGLEMATTMSVVTPSGTGVVSSAPLGTGKYIPQVIADTSGLPLNADYFLDPVSTNVWDESMQPLNTVNTILCVVAQARAGDMVNTGPYIALINLEKCEQGQGQTNANGATGVEYEKWIVESVRAFNNSPQYVNIWWPKFEDNSFPNGALLAQAVISAEVSNNNPFGGFEFNFKLIDKTAPTDPPYFTGSLRTVARSDDKPQFIFINEAGDAFNQAAGYYLEAANALFDDALGVTGVAKTFVWSSSFDVGAGTLTTQQDTYRLAFNTNNFLRSKSEFNGVTTTPTNTCLDRTAFDTQVWRYNIYDASTGARTILNGSFSFKYLGQYGNVGYNGLWYEDETVLIPDGATLDRDLPDGSTTPVDMHLSNGLMQRKSANTETVVNLLGQRMYFWGNNPDTALTSPSATDPSNGFDAWAVDVIIVSAENRFVVTGGINFTNTGAQFTASTTGSTDLQRMLTTTPLFFWSDALAGWVSFIDDTAANASWAVTYYTEEKIIPSDSAFTGSTISLICYDRCPIGGLVQADITAAAGDINALFYPTNATAKLYTATATVDGKVVLTDGSAANAPVSIVGLDISALNAGDRLDSGPMVTVAPASGLPYSVYDEPISYSWRTGDNYWDRLITVSPQGSSTVIVFDKPIRFDYTHEAVNELNASNATSPYIGSKMILQYDGPGNLYGFPYSQVSGTNRWVSPVVLKDAVLLTDLNTNTYITKGVMREQTMQLDATPTNCDVLDSSLADALQLPRGSDIVPVGITLADKPTVTDPPAVIDGELQ